MNIRHDLRSQKIQLREQNKNVKQINFPYLNVTKFELQTYEIILLRIQIVITIVMKEEMKKERSIKKLLLNDANVLLN